MKTSRATLAAHMVFAAIIATSAFSISKAEARTKLKKSEVQKLFIGKPWRGPGGTFRFKSSGTYTYRHKNGKTFGPLTYRLGSDGTIRGQTTMYRFYRKPDGGYLYWHSRSQRYYPARP